jgi:hypothetical protein
LSQFWSASLAGLAGLGQPDFVLYLFKMIQDDDDKKNKVYLKNKYDQVYWSNGSTTLGFFLLGLFFGQVDYIVDLFWFFLLWFQNLLFHYLGNYGLLLFKKNIKKSIGRLFSNQDDLWSGQQHMGLDSNCFVVCLKHVWGHTETTGSKDR